MVAYKSAATLIDIKNKSSIIYNKMKLYLIFNRNHKPTTLDLLQQACAARNIESIILDPIEVNPTRVVLEKGDALYRISTHHNLGAKELEAALIRPDIATFRTNSTPAGVNNWRDDPTSYAYLGIPAPKTVGYIPQDRQVLLDVVDELGGFPIILKAMGGSHGVGVMRVDSSESLFSVSDYVSQSDGEVILKEYCDVRSTARLIVLGDKVISSIEYTAPQGDFRSNEGKSPNVAPKKFSAEIENAAIRAVNMQGIEFGGVDIMMTDDGPKVAEANFPCFFPRCQMLTGDDIAGQMVDYLIAKSQRILAQK